MVVGKEKTIETLVEDCYSLFYKAHEPSEVNLDYLANNIKEAVKRAMTASNAYKKPTLRMSNMGVKDRKLWYIHNTPIEELENSSKVFDAPTLIKFLYGHILEELLLFFAKEAGHAVKGEQDEFIIEGVKGHRDCLIDNETVDVKTASNWSFKKFSEGTLINNDPFGYIAQLSGYTHAEGGDRGYFFTINKETGELALLKVDKVDMIDPVKRIKHIKEVIKQKEPPKELCFPDEPLGKSGNRVLNSNCTFCDFKEKCWSFANNGRGLRKFKYSNGVKYLTEVVNTPKVEEIFDE